MENLVKNELSDVTIFETICKTVVSISHVDHCGLLLFDNEFTSGEVVSEYPKFGVTGKQIPLNGIVEQLITLKEPVQISDVTSEKDLGIFKEGLDSFGFKSLALFPITFNGKLFGSFSLAMKSSRKQFSLEEIETCSSFASLVSLLLESNNKNKLQEYLRSFVTSLGPELNKKELLMIIIESAVNILKAKSGGIYEYSSSKSELVMTACYNLDTSLEGKILKVGEGLAGKLVAEKRSWMYENDYESWEGKTEKYKDEKFGAVLEVLLQWQGEIYGVIYVNDTNGRQFTDDDALMLNMFGNSIIIAFINSGLLKEQKERINKLEELSKASSEIMDNLEEMNLNRRLDLIVSHIKKLLNAESVGLFLIDLPKNQNVMFLKASIGHADGIFEKNRPFIIHDELGAGLTGWIAAQKKPISLNGPKLRTHPARNSSMINARNHTSSGICSALIMAPLIIKGKDERIIGWIRADNKLDENGCVILDEPFNEEDLSLLSLFSDIAVDSIQGAEIVEKLRTQNEITAQNNSRLQKINEFVKTIITADTENAVLAAITNGAKQLFEADIVSTWSYDSRSGDFIRRQMVSEGLTNIQEKDFQSKPPSKNGTSYKLLSDKYQAIEDIYSPEGRSYISPKSIKLLSECNVKSVIGLALHCGTENLGVLYADYFNQRKFSDYEESLAEEFNVYAGLALLKARFLDQLKQLKESMKTINKVSITDDLDTFLLEIVQQLKKMVTADRVIITIDDFDKAEPFFSNSVIDSNNEEQLGFDIISFIDSIGNDPNPSKLNKLRTGLAFFKFNDCVFWANLVNNQVKLGNLLIVFNWEKRFSDYESENIGIFIDQVSMAIHVILQYKQLLKKQHVITATRTLAYLGLEKNDKHEIRTSAINILNSSNLLLNDIGTLDRKTIVQKLAAIQENADKIRDKVDTEYIHFMNIEQDMDIFGINDLLHQYIRIKFNKNNISYQDRVVNESLMSERDSIRGNRWAIETLLHNLVSNSVKAMRGFSGTQVITFETKDVRDFVEVAIIDNGKGFDPLMAEKLKKGFYTTQGGYTQDGLGTGLIIATMIMDVHNGYIRLIDSQPGHTRISVYFRRHDAKE